MLNQTHFFNDFEIFLKVRNISFELVKYKDSDCIFYFLENKIYVCLRYQNSQNLKEMLFEMRENNLNVMLIRQNTWEENSGIIKSRILTKLGFFKKINARHCVVKRIDKFAESTFLKENHLQGSVKAKFKYGMFLKTAYCEKFLDLKSSEPQLVAVASFSAARIMKTGDRAGNRSFEWIRYASLQSYIVVGGMGKFLNNFVKEHQPDDMMTYVDFDWSVGESYHQLGFENAGFLDPKPSFIADDFEEKYTNSGSLKLIKTIKKHEIIA